MENDKLTRKARRKNARKAKNQARIQAWTIHQAKQRNKRAIPHVHTVSKLGLEKDQSNTVKSKQQMSSLGDYKMNCKMSKKKCRPTKFEEYLALEEKRSAKASFEEDLELERRLAKKLKIKHGLFHDTSDGLSDLLDGLVSSSNIVEEKTKYGTSTRCLQIEPNEDKARESDQDDRNVAHHESDFDDSSMEEVLADNSDLDNSSDLELPYADDCKELPAKPLLDPNKAGRDLHHVEVGEDEPSYCTEKGGHEQAVPSPQKSKAEVGLSLAKYVAPHRRSEYGSSNELTQLQRHTRGLLNRLSEDNVESIAPDIFLLFQGHGRRVMTDIVTNEILVAVSSGPRGNEQYAAVFAAFVAAVASSIGIDFGAKFLSSFAENFEEQQKKEDSLAIRNMVLLLSYLYIFALISCDVIYDLLCLLSKSLTELDVSIILTFLQTCGMGLRADDPVAMKDFVLSVQHRCEDLKAAAVQSGTIFYTGKRMQFMLETICEIKDNKKRAKQEKVPHARLKKWLQKLGVEEVQLRALKWKKLVDPDKKGQWWISGYNTDQADDGNFEVAELIHKETAESEKMLQLAALQKMNTDIRRAIFCVVMSGEDYMDAFEKILRIKLTGKQDREIMRVIVECCLQEKIFNKYYSLLIGKLCHHDKNHKFTLQHMEGNVTVFTCLLENSNVLLELGTHILSYRKYVSQCLRHIVHANNDILR